MAHVSISQTRSDCLEIEVGRRWARAGWALALALSWALLYLVAPLTAGWALALLVLGVGVESAAAVLLARALKTHHFVLSRTPGRLMLDGEPLELARVELRLLHWPVVRRPRGYALSLWMLTSAGPLDLPLGSFKTMVQAAGLSGELEEFLQLAGVRQPGRVK